MPMCLLILSATALHPRNSNRSSLFSPSLHQPNLFLQKYQHQLCPSPNPAWGTPPLSSCGSSNQTVTPPQGLGTKNFPKLLNSDNFNLCSLFPQFKRWKVLLQSSLCYLSVPSLPVQPSNSHLTDVLHEILIFKITSVVFLTGPWLI